MSKVVALPWVPFDVASAGPVKRADHVSERPATPLKPEEVDHE